MDKISAEILLISGITSIFIITIFLLIIATGIIVLVLVYQKKQVQYLSEKKALKVSFEKEILETQIEIQEQTLKNISQEIHDNIGQVLSLARLNLSSVAYIPDDAIQTKVEDTKQLVIKALRDLRDLSRSMHGDKIAELGLAESINHELKIMQNSGQFITCLNITGYQYKLEPQTEMVLFRMVQESLNNAIKHSKAKNIEVQLNYNPGTFSLSVTDDGIGFNPATLKSTETGIGLKSMQNRAALIGGVFSLDTNPEKGTQITIELKNTEG